MALRYEKNDVKISSASSNNTKKYKFTVNNQQQSSTPSVLNSPSACSTPSSHSTSSPYLISTKNSKSQILTKLSSSSTPSSSSVTIKSTNIDTNKTQASTTSKQNNTPKSTKRKVREAPSHAVVYWINEDNHGIARTSDFFELENAIDISEDEIYNVKFNKKGQNKQQFFPARCVALGDKSSCTKHLESIIATQVKKTATKAKQKYNLKQNATKTTMEKILNNDQQNTSQNSSPKRSSLSNQIDLLTSKIKDLENVIDNKQFILDSTLAELEASNNKVERLMKSFAVDGGIEMVIHKCRVTLEALTDEPFSEQVPLHASYPKIRVNKAVYDKLVDFCKIHNCSYVFRKACYALISDQTIWANHKGIQLQDKFANEIAACYAFVKEHGNYDNESENHKNWWHRTIASTIITQMPAENRRSMAQAAKKASTETQNRSSSKSSDGSSEDEDMNDEEGVEDYESDEEDPHV